MVSDDTLRYMALAVAKELMSNISIMTVSEIAYDEFFDLTDEEMDVVYDLVANSRVVLPDE